MCAIWLWLQLHSGRMVRPPSGFWNVAHRGPDSSTLVTFDSKRVYAGFHRLAVINPGATPQNQPIVMRSPATTTVLLCNGEIYNYRSFPGAGESDCRTLLDLWASCDGGGTSSRLTARAPCDPDAFARALRDSVRGEYAFAILEFEAGSERLTRVVLGRDPVGIRPLYVNTDLSAYLCACSELKGFAAMSDCSVREFPPGTLRVYTLDGGSIAGGVHVRDITFASPHLCCARPRPPPGEFESRKALFAIQRAVVDAVLVRLHADRPLAFLLSGGVDSSLVCAIASRALRRPISTFCCGMRGGTDLSYAQKVADHIRSRHSSVVFTPSEALAAIPDVIQAVETWDTTTVRASVGQYLVARHIAATTDCKVVLVGEGPDEVCSSYLFNWSCPSGEALQEVASDLIRDVHMYDVRRADRCVSCWGMEARVPLLDPAFIEAYWSIPPELRLPQYRGVEKWWLRAAFANTGLLPEDVLWRQKEAFSDGISSRDDSWFSTIQQHVEGIVTDQDMVVAASVYPYVPPPTKEALWYRREFCDRFPHAQTCIPRYWVPRFDSDGNAATTYVDPSARTLRVYQRATSPEQEVSSDSVSSSSNLELELELELQSRSGSGSGSGSGLGLGLGLGFGSDSESTQTNRNAIREEGPPSISLECESSDIYLTCAHDDPVQVMEQSRQVASSIGAYIQESMSGTWNWVAEIYPEHEALAFELRLVRNVEGRLMIYLQKQIGCSMAFCNAYCDVVDALRQAGVVETAAPRFTRVRRLGFEGTEGMLSLPESREAQQQAIDPIQTMLYSMWCDAKREGCRLIARLSDALVADPVQIRRFVDCGLYSEALKQLSSSDRHVARCACTAIANLCRAARLHPADRPCVFRAEHLEALQQQEIMRAGRCSCRKTAEELGRAIVDMRAIIAGET